MDRKVQVALLVVIIAALVVAGAYAAGWFRKTSTAEITCFIHHEEGSEGVAYIISTYEDDWSPWVDKFDERRGEVESGEVAEVIITHKWDGIGPSTVSVELSLLQIGDSGRTFWDHRCLMMVPGGHYRFDCHVLLRPSDEVSVERSIQDVYMIEPSIRDIFTQYGSATLELSLHNDDPDDSNHFLVSVDGESRVYGNLGPMSTRSITLDVSWIEPYLSYGCHIEMTPDDLDSTVQSEVIQVSNGTTAPVAFVI